MQFDNSLQKLTLTTFNITQKTIIKNTRNSLYPVCGRVIAQDDQAEESVGTAFFYSKYYYMITCFHVIDGKKYIKVQFPLFNNQMFEAQLVASNPAKDLAVLKLIIPPNFPEYHDLLYPKLIPFISEGDSVITAGYNYEGAFQVTNGFVTGQNDPRKIIVTNFTDNATSGGPCVGSRSFDLVGIIQGDYGITHHQTRLIPYHQLVNFIEQYPHLPQLDIYN